MSLVDTSRLEWRLARLRAAPAALPQAEYRFLLRRLIDAATLAKAEVLALRWGVHPHDVLLANGWIKPEDYYRALAETCGRPFTPNPRSDPASTEQPSLRQCLAYGLLRERDRRFVFAPDRLRPNALRAMLAQFPPDTFSFAPPLAVRSAIRHHFAATFAQGAVEDLAMRRPEQSARTPLPFWHLLSIAFAVVFLFGGIVIAPLEAIRILTLALALLFVPVIALRLIAFHGLLRRGEREDRISHARVPEAELPVYTLLVPLYREAHMLPSLMTALTRLDWPAAKLDVKLILEAVDTETIAAARMLGLPGNVEIVIVPELHPRTKPKALNYALPFARGEYLVIYDAEDQPERDQLRRAFDAFRAGPANLATVQARLNIYNAADTWLTKQFAVEYCALFDGLLPALDRLNLPIPLGGTSNHFRVSALRWLMAWDPFNVTEDADLGIRLARNGYRCGVLHSTTYEEAPCRFMGWLRQRTRWLKGFVQTWLVHMRRPSALWQELGPRGFLGFQVMIGGTVLSALVHPWFYALVAFELVSGGLLTPPKTLLGWPFWIIAWFDLVTGYLAAMALGLLAVRRRGHFNLVQQIPLMPLYWLAISVAAYRALWQFITARFHWEKTEHGQAASSFSGNYSLRR